MGKIFNLPLYLPILLIIVIINSNCASFNKDVKDAKNYMAAGNYDLAAQSLIKQTYENPDDQEAQFLLGECYLYQGYYDQAKELFTNLIQISNYEYSPRVGMAYKNAGDKANDKGKYETANTMYQKAVEYRPDLRQEIVEQRYNQGKAYFQNGKYELAENQFELVSKLDNIHNQKFCDLLFKVGNEADDDNCLDFYKMAKKYSSTHNDEIGKRLLSIAYSKNTEDEIQNWRKEASGFIELPPDYQVCVIGPNPFRLKKGELSDLWMRVPSGINFSVSISSYSNNYEVLNRDRDGNIKVFRIWRGEKLPDQISPDIKIKALANLLGELIIRKKFIDK
jgi:tetratricopeptide (TPR) repeat protein